MYKIYNVCACTCVRACVHACARVCVSEWVKSVETPQYFEKYVFSQKQSYKSCKGLNNITQQY